jgi:hypothetical protein
VLESDNFVIYKNDLYYHSDCFINNPIKENRKLLSIEEKEKLIKASQLENKEKIKDIIDKNHFYKYIQRRYDLVYLPSFVFVKFDSVFNGTYKNLSEPVSVEDLLDMWERKESYLDKQYQWKLSKGESMDGLGRMWYDLATLMSKIGSYKKWKDEQKANENKDKIIESQTKINYNLINKSTLNNINNKNKVDEIADYLEEI